MPIGIPTAIIGSAGMSGQVSPIVIAISTAMMNPVTSVLMMIAPSQ